MQGGGSHSGPGHRLDGFYLEGPGSGRTPADPAVSGQRRFSLGSPGDLPSALARAARRLTGAQGAAVVRREGDCSHYIAEDADEPLWVGERVELGACPCGSSILSTRPLVLEQIDSDTLERFELLRGTFARSLLSVPTSGSAPIGAIGVYWASPHRASDQEVMSLSALVELLDPALQPVQHDKDLEAAREMAEQRARELADWKRRYEAAIAASREICFEWEVPSGAVVWSGLVDQTLGIPWAEVQPNLKWWLERVHPDDLGRVERALGRARQSSEPVSFEYRVKHANGTYLTVHQRGGCFVGESGTPNRMVGFIADMSDRSQLEAHLRHAQKMEALGQLAGGVAHDFNNLLVPILAYTEMGTEALPDGHPVKRDLATVLDAANRARDLVGQLLLFGRKQLSEARDFSLNSEIYRFSSILRRVIRENIELDLDLTHLPARILGDRTQIQQILMNLAVNAQDAMPEGGSLRIRTDEVVVPEGHDTPTALRPGRYLRLSVSDSGTGMDEETRARIFEPFFTTKPAGQGTGLGLATVYSVVHQHEGEIRCHSEPGHGTTFEIYFPRAASTTTTPAPGALRATTGGPEVILVAEDDRMVREVTRRMLEQLGYTVLCAADAESAVDVARQHDGPIHLLLTDLVLPRTDGRKLREELLPLYPELKALYMSGYASDPRLPPDGSGGPTLLRKPFGMEQLLQAVRLALDENLS